MPHRVDPCPALPQPCSVHSMPACPPAPRRLSCRRGPLSWPKTMPSDAQNRISAMRSWKGGAQGAPQRQRPTGPRSASEAWLLGTPASPSGLTSKAEHSIKPPRANSVPASDVPFVSSANMTLHDVHGLPVSRPCCEHETSLSSRGQSGGSGQPYTCHESHQGHECGAGQPESRRGPSNGTPRSHPTPYRALPMLMWT